MYKSNFGPMTNSALLICPTADKGKDSVPVHQNVSGKPRKTLACVGLKFYFKSWRHSADWITGASGYPQCAQKRGRKDIDFEKWQYWWRIFSGKFYTSEDSTDPNLFRNVGIRLGIWSYMVLWHVLYQKVNFLLIEKSFFENFHFWWRIFSSKFYTSGDSTGPKLTGKVHIRLGIWPMWNFYFICKPFLAENGSNRHF